MFNKILLPLPSEYYPEFASRRAIEIAYKFKSKLTLEYIFEKSVIDKINNVSSGAVTQCSLEEMSEEIENVEVGSESSVIFDKIEQEAQGKNIDLRKLIHSGHHSDEILDCIREHEIDLIITEFHRDTLLDYNFLYKSPVPIWLEQNGNRIKKIFGVLTNLSPNLLVPTAAFKLSKTLNVPLHLYYVLDTKEMSNEETDLKVQKELIKDLKERAKKINVYFEYDTVTQEISNFLDHTFRHENNSLVILGRFKKPVKLPFISLDKKIETSKKLDANVLMLK